MTLEETRYSFKGQNCSRSHPCCAWRNGLGFFQPMGLPLRTDLDQTTAFSFWLSGCQAPWGTTSWERCEPVLPAAPMYQVHGTPSSVFSSSSSSSFSSSSFSEQRAHYSCSFCVARPNPSQFLSKLRNKENICHGSREHPLMPTSPSTPLL